MADDDYSVGSMAKSVADGVLGTVGGDLGALLIGAIFPSGNTPPSYFDQVYQRITQIVNQSIDQNDITMISGALNGVQSWVTNTYGPLKSDPASTPALLHAAVQPFVDSVVENVIGPLMTDTLAKPGFSVFLLAAGVHLALVQEQAYTDPAHQTEGGYDSPFATSVRKYAQQYHDFIGKTWQEIRTDRANAVTTPQLIGDPYHHLSGGNVVWTDTMDGTSGSIPTSLDPAPDSVMAQANVDRSAHIATVVSALGTSLGGPDTIAANFLGLVTWPLPVTTARILSLSGSGGVSINFDQGYQQKVWAYSLSWNTGGGTASFDGGIGNVDAAGSLSWNQYSPPALPSTLTVTGPYGPPVTQQINW